MVTNYPQQLTAARVSTEADVRDDVLTVDGGIGAKAMGRLGQFYDRTDAGRAS